MMINPGYPVNPVEKKDAAQQLLFSACIKSCAVFITCKQSVDEVKEAQRPFALISSTAIASFQQNPQPSNGRNKNRTPAGSHPN